MSWEWQFYSLLSLRVLCYDLESTHHGNAVTGPTGPTGPTEPTGPTGPTFVL